MKKSIFMLFLASLLLAGCNNESSSQTNQETQPQNSSSNTMSKKEVQEFVDGIRAKISVQDDKGNPKLTDYEQERLICDAFNKNKDRLINYKDPKHQGNYFYKFEESNKEILELEKEKNKGDKVDKEMNRQNLAATCSIRNMALWNSFDVGTLQNFKSVEKICNILDSMKDKDPCASLK